MKTQKSKLGGLKNNFQILFKTVNSFLAVTKLHHVFTDSFKMKTTEIQDALLKNYYQRGHIYCCTNFSGTGYDEADLMSVSGTMMVYEFEVKISRSDFKADFKKDFKHKRLSGELPLLSGWKIPNRFYYVCPEGMIRIDEVPVYAGLIYVEPAGFLNEVKKAPMIHKEKDGINVITRMCQTHTARAIFGCAYHTYKNKLLNES